MDDTRITLSDAQHQRLASPYNEQLESDHTWDLNAFEPAGGIHSTANDMLKLLAAGMSDDERPVVQATHRAWTKLEKSPVGGGIGLAWCVARDGVSWWHNGRTGGYSSAAFVCPPKQLGVVLLVNTASEAPAGVAEKILQSLLGIKTEPIVVRKAIKVPPEVLRQYVGSYALSQSFSITVTLEDGQLKAQATGQGKFPIFPESADRFFLQDRRRSTDVRQRGRRPSDQAHPAPKRPQSAGHEDRRACRAVRRAAPAEATAPR